MLFFPVVAVATEIALWKVSGIAPRIAIVVAFALVAVVMIRGSHRRYCGAHDADFCPCATNGYRHSAAIPRATPAGPEPSVRPFAPTGRTSTGR